MAIQKAPRRSRHNSVQGTLDLTQSVLTSKVSWPNLVPHGPQKDMELELFDRLAILRAPADWSHWDLIELARLAALTVAQIADEVLLNVEGSLIPNPSAPQYKQQNPRLGAVNNRQKILTALARELGVATPSVDPRTLTTGGKRAAAIKTKMEEADNSDLLA